MHLSTPSKCLALCSRGHIHNILDGKDLVGNDGAKVRHLLVEVQEDRALHVLLQLCAGELGRWVPLRGVVGDVDPATAAIQVLLLEDNDGGLHHVCEGVDVLLLVEAVCIEYVLRLPCNVCTHAVGVCMHESKQGAYPFESHAFQDFHFILEACSVERFIQFLHEMDV